MPLPPTHKTYDEHIETWSRIRDTMAGEKRIKDKGITYLPMLHGATEEEFHAYKMRAQFLNVVGRTVKGMAGQILRKEPQRENIPNELEPVLDNATVDSEDIEHLTKQALEDVLSLGRMGVLTDVANDGAQPYAAVYAAENIWDWKTKRVAGRKELAYVLLFEGKEPVRVGNKTTNVYHFRELELGSTPVAVGSTSDGMSVVARTFDAYVEEDIPTAVNTEVTLRRHGGSAWDRLPFTFFSVRGTASAIEEAPVEALADTALALYRNSADYEHGLHFTALPQAFVAGFDGKDTPVLTVGSTRAWVSPNPEAKAQYLEFTGQGLGAIKAAMDDKKKEMAVLGGRMLESPQGRESGEAIIQRQAGELSVLASAALSVEQGITGVIQQLALWRGFQDEAVDDMLLSLNTDLDTRSANAQVLQVLLNSLQLGAITKETYVHNLAKASLLPDGVTVEEEVEQAGLQATTAGD